MAEYELFNDGETCRLGCEIGRRAKPGSVICLCGELGAGKTALAKGIAAGLGIKDEITSPTFSIVNEYSGRLRLFHFDVYRIIHPSEMEETGFEDSLLSGGVLVIEWADIIKELIPDNALWITIEKDYSKGDDYRRIRIENYDMFGD